MKSMVQKSLVVLVGTSMAVCGCSCSSKGRGVAEPSQASLPAGNEASLTLAQGSAIKGRYIGGLFNSPNGIKVADAALSIDSFSASVDPAQSAEVPVLIAKLELSGTTLNTVTLSEQIKFNSSAKKFEAEFAVQDQVLSIPLTIKMQFSAEMNHLTADMADGSNIARLVTGVAEVTETVQPQLVADPTPIGMTHSPSSSPKPPPKIGLAPKPVTKPGTNSGPTAAVPVVVPGHLFLDLNLDAGKKPLPVVDSKKIKALTVSYYQGSTKFSGGASKPVAYSIGEPAISSDLALYAAVATQGLGQQLSIVTSTFDNGGQLIYAPSLIDLGSGHINGTAALGTSADSSLATTVTRTVTMACEPKGHGALECTHKIGQKSVAVTGLQLTPAAPIRAPAMRPT